MYVYQYQSIDKIPPNNFIYVRIGAQKKHTHREQDDGI